MICDDLLKSIRFGRAPFLEKKKDPQAHADPALDTLNNLPPPHPKPQTNQHHV